MLLEPNRTLFATSIDVLIEDSIDASIADVPEQHELIINCTDHFKNIRKWEIGKADIFYEEDEDKQYKRQEGLYRPHELLGLEGSFIDPTDCLKLNNGNIDTILNLAESLISNRILIGMGLLMTDNKGNFFNPLHPLHAKQALEEGCLPFNDEYTIIFYPSIEAKAIHKDPDMKQYILDLLEHTDTKYDSTNYDTETAEDKKERVLTEISGLSYNQSINRIISSKVRPKNVITPVSTVDVKGIIYPYYGAIESHIEEAENYYLSRNLFPMLTGNVSGMSDVYFVDDLEEVNNGEMHSRIDYDQTCIGEYSQSEYKNLKHMNQMNVQSMYHQDVISEDYPEWIYYCIKQSIKLLTQLKEKTDGKEREETREQEATIVSKEEPPSERPVQHEQVVSFDLGSEVTF